MVQPGDRRAPVTIREIQRVWDDINDAYPGQKLGGQIKQIEIRPRWRDPAGQVFFLVPIATSLIQVRKVVFVQLKLLKSDILQGKQDPVWRIGTNLITNRNKLY